MHRKILFWTEMIFLVILLTGCGTGRNSSKDLEELFETLQNVSQEGSMPDAQETQMKETEEGLLYVYVCGAVRKSGVVRLPTGSRALDAVEAAGGLSEEADLDSINLARILTDGEKLYVPDETQGSRLWEETEEEETSALIDLNTAGVSRLCELPGIGKAKAEQIIAYREEYGAFQTIEDIMKVPGIKEAAFRKIKDRIIVH